jgi:multisubunit Na+/H+ antiporter MnhG subunit
MKSPSSLSIATVVGSGFIILGMLNLFATQFYHKTAISSTSKIPGIIFVLTGIVIIILKTVNKPRE